MKMDEVANSGNDEFYTPRYAVKPLLKYIPKGTKIWCPFDTKDSLIVDEFREHGCMVSHTHLKEGQDFFKIPLVPCDYIISNPPYSKKGEVFERLFSLKLPFAMLVGVVGLFESEKRFSLFSSNKFEIMWLNKRISYFKDYSDQKPSLNPPFSSIWLTSKVLPRDNIFERVSKK